MSTKAPDLVDKGAEHNVIRLIHDGNGPGRRGTPAGSLFEISAKSSFRLVMPTKVPKKRCFIKMRRGITPEKYGISALMARLQELLTSNTRRELPLVRIISVDINKLANILV